MTSASAKTYYQVEGMIQLGGPIAFAVPWVILFHPNHVDILMHISTFVVNQQHQPTTLSVCSPKGEAQECTRGDGLLFSYHFLSTIFPAWLSSCRTKTTASSSASSLTYPTRPTLQSPNNNTGQRMFQAPQWQGLSGLGAGLSAPKNAGCSVGIQFGRPDQEK